MVQNVSVQYIKLFGADGTTEIFPESVTGTGQSGTTTDTINYDIHPVNTFEENTLSFYDVDFTTNGLSQVNTDLGIDSSGNSVIKEIAFYQMIFSDPANKPTEWFVKGSIDNLDWDVVDYRNISSSLLIPLYLTTDSLSFNTIVSETTEVFVPGNSPPQGFDESREADSSMLTSVRTLCDQRETPEYKYYRIVFTAGVDSKKIALTEMDFYSHSDADGDLINYEPNFICGFSPRGFEASQLLDANHREWKDFIHGRRNHWERKQIESYINVINESMGMWTEKGETNSIFGFKSAISVIKYSLF
jgi:hypothetical protein